MAPHTAFIIPYRNRQAHKKEMDVYLDNLMSARRWTTEDVVVVYAHQCDNRPFNRGGMKNCGFIGVRDTFPDDYGDMNIVFHDVDSIPEDIHLFPYSTTQGVVAHYYGFTHVLGGILTIKGRDFEACNGFPSLWGWGVEDNELQKRVLQNNMTIDRSVFVGIKETTKMRPMGQERVKIVSRTEAAMFKNETDLGGLSQVSDVDYRIENEMMNIRTFSVPRAFSNNEFSREDMKLTGGKILLNPGSFRRNWSLAL
jgi:hypothetical protein